MWLLSGTRMSSEANLTSLRLLDQQALAAAVGRLQGARLDQSAFGISATTLPRPATSSTTGTETTTGGTSSVTDTQSTTVKPSGTETLGSIVTGSSSSTTQKETGSDSLTTTAQEPRLPAPPAVPSTFAVGGQVGPAAQDILAEQVMLTYQVVNLRLLLEQSISDRVFSGDAMLGTRLVGFADARRQAVLGFQINIEPTRRFKRAVAEVELRVLNCGETAHATQQASGWPEDSLAACVNYNPPGRSKGRSARWPDPSPHLKTLKLVSSSVPPSIVGLMPQEKTYNVATLTRSSTGFGFGALVSVFNLGVSGSRSRETIYLVKDTDTVALARSNDGNGPAFGWQFRPVLGRESVEPGLRHVFAVIALPNTIAEDFVGAIEVRTTWRKYDAKRGLVGDEIGEPQSTAQGPFVVPQLDTVTGWLSPTSATVRLLPAGLNSMLVELPRASNLFKDTKLVIGDSLFSPGQGIELQGERGLRFVAPTRLLGTARGVYLAGRYGKALPVRRVLGRKLRVVDNKAVAAIGAKRTTLTVRLQGEDGKPYEFQKGDEKDTQLQAVPPVLVVGETVLLPSAPSTVDAGATVRVVKYEASTELVQSVRKAIVKELLGGDDYAQEVAIEKPESFAVADLTILAQTKTHVTMGVQGALFDCSTTTVWINNRVHACDDGVLSIRSADFITLRLTAGDYAASSHVIFQHNAGTPDARRIIKELPKAVAVVQPVLPSPMASLAEGTVKTVVVSGRSLDSIAAVRFDGQRLGYAVTRSQSGEELRIAIPAALTAIPGHKELVLDLRDGSQARAVVVVTRRARL